MGRRGMRVCSTPGCPELTQGGRCAGCQSDAERRRGTRAQRGYGHRHKERFREGVLAKHPVCVTCGNAPATEADHYPVDKRTLELRGLNADDPIYGRGLCKECHSKETARNQPGGWNSQLY